MAAKPRTELWGAEPVFRLLERERPVALSLRLESDGSGRQVEVDVGSWGRLPSEPRGHHAAGSSGPTGAEV